MNQRMLPVICFLATVFSLVWGTSLHAQIYDETILIRTPVDHDLYTAGRQIEIQADVAGDLVAAGQLVTVNATVEDDVIVAGETINLRARVLDDVRAAGRQMFISSEIADHLVAAGESITLEVGSKIGSWAWLAGETIRVYGQIGSELKVAARRVIISGEIQGDVELFAKQIDILDGAHIHGNLIWHSKQPLNIEEGSIINGQLIEKPFDFEYKEHDKGLSLAASLFFAISLMATGSVFYLLFPQPTNSASNSLQQRPWLCLAIGFAVLFVTPFVIMLLFATLIGSLLAFMLLACYLVILLFSLVIGIFAVSEQGLRRYGKWETAGRGQHLLAFVFAVIVLWILQLIPFIGGLIKLAIVLFGAGGVSLVIHRARSVAIATT